MKELAFLLESKQVSSLELVKQYLARMEAQEKDLKALITVAEEDALQAARAADQRRAKNEPLSPWDGIPIVLKDNICTQGLRTTCASRLLQDYVPLYDAAVVTRLKQAGLPILGKANLDEFAMGSSTEYSAFGVTANPHDLSRVAGGSSGGSAAAVAAGEAPWALGTDTGGSVRQPAAFCGVVGLKPTYGRVSRYGVAALAPSLDQVGPLAETVASTAILFSLIAGSDPQDATSFGSRKFEVPIWRDSVLPGLKIGVPEEFFGEGLCAEVAAAVRRSLAILEQGGAQLVPISLGMNKYVIDTYLIIMTAEASSSLARYDGVRYGRRVAAPDSKTMLAKTRGAGLGAEVKRRIMLGTYLLSAGCYEAYYERALKLRTLIREEMERALQKVDVIVTPTTPTTAFKIFQKRHPLEMYLSDLYTAGANLSGIPALSLPCGRDSNSLPIGVQIMAGPFQEEVIFQVAYFLEQNLGGRV